MKNTRKSASRLQEDLKRMQESYFPGAIKIMNTPLGRALRRPGTTFRVWSNTSPANIWIESKRGATLFHSDESDFNCPIREAFRTLRSFLDKAPSDMDPGGRAFVLSPEFIAKVDQVKLEENTAAVSRPARSGPRL